MLGGHRPGDGGWHVRDVIIEREIGIKPDFIFRIDHPIKGR